MPLTTYPATLDNFTSKTDGVDTVMAQDVNELQAAIEAIETELGVDPAGNETNVVTRLNALDTLTATGWIAVSDTWTYASATTFTIAGVDRTSLFTSGRKLKLTQTSVKNFYVVSSVFSTNTTVTITGGSDYTLANAAITSPCISYADTPAGFPHWFAYTYTWTGAGGNPAIQDATTYARFRMQGKTVTYLLYIQMGASTTYGTGAWTFSVPVAVTTTSAAQYMGQGFMYDQSDSGKYYGYIPLLATSHGGITYWLNQATNGASIQATSAAPFTWAQGDRLSFQITYEAA